MVRKGEVRTMDASPSLADEGPLLALLRRQNDVYRRLRVLADRQKALVAEDDVQPLLALLAERQKLVDSLVELNRQLAPYRADWTARYSRLDAATRKEVAALLEEANAALGAVLLGDQRDSAALEARKRDLGGRLSTTDAASRASHAYAVAGGAGRPSLTDAQV